MFFSIDACNLKQAMSQALIIIEKVEEAFLCAQYSTVLQHGHYAMLSLDLDLVIHHFTRKLLHVIYSTEDV